MLPRVFQPRSSNIFRRQFHQRFNIGNSENNSSSRTFGTQTNHRRYEMDKAYLRNLKNSEELHISFHYTNERLQIDRDFNFCRRMNEKIDDALLRIRSNIEKELQKRAKRGKKRVTPAEVPEQVPAEVPSEVDISFLRGDDGVCLTDITFKELLDDTVSLGQLKLRVLDKNFDVVLNQPWALNIILPGSILAGHLVYPNKVELQFAERKYCQGVWYKATMPLSGDMQRHAQWSVCGNGMIYLTTKNDIGCYLKFGLTPGNHDGESGPTLECMAKWPVQAGPSICPFELRHLHTKQRLSALDDEAMRVVSYNLLADYYADSDYSRKVLFPYCPPYALAIDYRKQLFLKELMGYNADIICLQEVDLKIFEIDLKIVLGGPNYGMRGHIAQKGTCAEGVATFYRESRFELVQNFELTLGAQLCKLEVFAQLWGKIRNNTALAQRISDRSTTLQVTLLKCRASERYVLVANTHLYYHPDADHIRLLQMGFSMMYVEDIYKQTLVEQKITDERNLALIFCGDFNSVPECGIFKLMTEGFVPNTCDDWHSKYSEAVKNVSLRQPYRMLSACGKPKYTNFTTLFAACLDYIFYQEDRLELLQIVPLPTVKDLEAHTAIPSVCFPSDHVALVADLKFKSGSQ